MPRRRLAAIALVLLLAGCKKELPPPSGDVAAALAIPTLDGAPFDPATLRGKPAIVMFWRVGCTYCMNEFPIVEQVARAEGAAAIAVLVAGSRDAAREIQQTWAGTILLDEGGELRRRYDVKKVPYTLVLRPDGTAARAFLGEQSASTLADAVDDAR